VIEQVRDYFKQWNRGGDIIEMDVSTMTAVEAATPLLSLLWKNFPGIPVAKKGGCL
jgi:hypothetical protein